MNKQLFSVKTFLVLIFSFLSTVQIMAQKKYSEKELAAMKQKLFTSVAGHAKDVQVMVDKIFSFGELGFQEIETSAYLTSVLEKNGFTIEKNISNIPTAWMAKFGSGSPVIALGSDIDCIPKASQKPGVAYKDPIVEGAPGHGEGHPVPRGRAPPDRGDTGGQPHAEDTALALGEGDPGAVGVGRGVD